MLGPHNANTMADALRAMPHLRSLSLCSHYSDTEIMTGHIPVVGVVLQGCSAQLTGLECRAISLAADQPFRQLARLSAALMRLTSLQVLKVPSFMYEVDSTFLEEQDALAAAAAAVASALPHLLPALSWMLGTLWTGGTMLCYNPPVCCHGYRVLSLPCAMFKPPPVA